MIQQSEAKVYRNAKGKTLVEVSRGEEAFLPNQMLTANELRELAEAACLAADWMDGEDCASKLRALGEEFIDGMEAV